jgi:hypothetical protein
MTEITITRRRGDHAHCWSWKVVDEETGRNMAGHELTHRKALDRAWKERERWDTTHHQQGE